MKNQDTIHLLQECDAGTKMAVSSIDEVLDKVRNQKLRKLLEESRNHHEKLGDEIHILLGEAHSETKEPNPLAKGMSRIKTTVKTSLDDSDQTISDLLTDGCNMGIKSLFRHMNQHPDADNTSLDVCKRLIRMEEKLREDLREYL